MKLTLKYFGQIAEVLNKYEEIIVLEQAITAAELIAMLEEKNETLKNLDYKIAVNQSLVSHASTITNDSEIALLPPFAGG